MWRAIFGKTQTTRATRRRFLSFFAAGGAIGAGSALAQDAPERDQALVTYRNRQTLARANVAPDVRQVSVLGYHSAEDGGGGLYIRRRNPQADPASLRSADGAWWTLRPKTGSVSVRQFGAVGDGFTDDTESIRHATEYVRQSNITRTLLFPPGQYRVTGPILRLKPGEKRLAFRGEDAETTQILLAADLDEPLIDIEGGAELARVEWITFSELTFRNQLRQFRGDCVRIRQAYHVDWLRCRLVGWNGHAFYFDDYWDSNIDGCRIIGCGSPNAADAARARVPFTQGKAAIWIGSSSRRVTSNNLNFNACQIESSWHNQMRLEDSVRRVHLNSCKFHGSQRAIITQSQLWIGGALSGKIASCVFAYGQTCDHIEFAKIDGRFRPRGWSIVGSDFTYSGGAAIRIRDGSHLTISANNFGQIGVNKESIVIEDTVPLGPKFRQIAITANSFDPREAPPRIERPVVLSTDVLGQVMIRPVGKGGAAQTVIMPPPKAGERAISNATVRAEMPDGKTVPMAQQRTIMKDAEAGALQFRVQQAGRLDPFLELDGAESKVRSNQTLEIAEARWDGPHLQLGPCHIWVDAQGQMRMKAGRPESDEDGTVIGA